MAIKTITVTGNYTNQDGSAASGFVTFKLSTALTSSVDNQIVSPVLQTATLTNGAFSMTLVATNDPDIEQQGATYTVTEHIDGAYAGHVSTRIYAVEIPYDAADGTVNLADLAPVEDAEISYGVTQAAFTAHTSDTTNVHGIADTSVLVTTDDLAGYATDADLSAHAADTTSVHGITDTAALVALLTRLELEAVIVTGTVGVADNVLKPGARIPHATTLSAVYARVGTAPTGSGLTVGVNRNGSEITTVTIAAGATSGSTTGLSVALASGDIITWDINSVGSSTAGADLAVQLIGV